MSSQQSGRVRGTRSRGHLVALAVLAAVPFWAAVGYLDPLAAWRPAPAPSRAPVAEVYKPGFSPARCWRLQQQMNQSLVGCPPSFRPRRPGSVLPPGDYPLPGGDNLMAGSAAAPGGS